MRLIRLDWLERNLAPNRKVALWRRRLAHVYRLVKRPSYPVEDIHKTIIEFFPNLEIDRHSVVIDLGANEGNFSLYFGRLGATVLAFEPNPWVARNASLRLRHLANVTLVTAAVGDRTSIVWLYFPEEYRRAPELHSGSASLELRNSAVDAKAAIPVFQIDFQEILGSFEKINFLKVDIEGTEGRLWSAIEVAWEKIEHLAIETHVRLLEPDDSEWILRARKFIVANGLEGRWRLDWP